MDRWMDGFSKYLAQHLWNKRYPYTFRQMKNLLLGFILFITSVGTGQQDINLDTCKTFTSIEEAMKHPEEVYILNLSKNKLRAAPEVIAQMTNLRVLNLSKNKITELPASFASLKALQEINLDKNAFETFPVVIVEMTNLKKLIISQNDVYGIPYDIKNLQQLEILDMWSTNLYDIPESLSELPNLKIFDLRVIQFSDEEKEHISQLLPNTKIHFSNSCNCSN